MNPKLERIIDKINKKEFEETEIMIFSDTETFHLKDLVALEEAIKTNEWVKENLKVLMLEPNDIVRGALGIDGSRGFYPDFTNTVNSIRVKTKNELANVLQMIRAGTFHYSRLGFGNSFSSHIKELDDVDLQELVSAVNESEWCQEYLNTIALNSSGISRIPSIKCRNLQELIIYDNPISEIAELECPNLLHVTAHSIGKFDIKAFKSCFKMEQIDAFDSNLRVPPNVMDYQNLFCLNVLEFSPFSPLGIYSLLLMNQKKNVQKYFSDVQKLATKFAEIYTQTEDFHIREDFHMHSLFYWGLEKPRHAIDVGKFIAEFKTPKHFFDDQVKSILSFMDKVYYIPFIISDGGKSISNPNPRPNNFRRSDKLDLLNAEYLKARGLLYSTIEGMLERYDQTGDIMADVEEKIAGSLDLDGHTKFFLFELLNDFKTLKEIFIAVDRPDLADAVITYTADNSSEWQFTLDVKRRLFESGKTHIDELRNKKKPKQKVALHM